MIRVLKPLVVFAWLGFLAANGLCQIQAIPEQVEVEQVISSLRFPTGLAWSRDGFLIVADSEKREIYRLDSGKRANPTHADPSGVQGIAYDTESRLYLCETEGRRIVRMDKKGKVETLVMGFEGKKLNGPNEVAVRKDGQLYFTDPAFASAIDRRELPFNGIFHVTPKGDVEAVARWENRPSGVALTQDGKHLLVSDADRHAVVEFDLDSKGAATNPKDLIKGVTGVPGGLRTDAAGRIYVAAQGVAIYSAEGKPERVLLESSRVLNVTFGDPDLETLFASTPRGVYRIRLGVKGALQY